MADFDIKGTYRFLYRDALDKDIECRVWAVCDADAISLARTARHGMALEVWTGSRLVHKFERLSFIDVVRAAKLFPDRMTQH